MHSILITFWCFVTAYKVCCGLFSSSFFSPKWPTDLQNSTSFSDNLPVFIYVSTDLRVAFSCRNFKIHLNLPTFIYASTIFLWRLIFKGGSLMNYNVFLTCFHESQIYVFFPQFFSSFLLKQGRSLQLRSKNVSITIYFPKRHFAAT